MISFVFFQFFKVYAVSVLFKIISMFKCDRRETLTVKIIKGPRAGRVPSGGVYDRDHMSYAQKLTSFLRT